MDKITDQIYIGNYDDAHNYKKLKEHGITAILNLSLNREDIPESREFETNKILYAKIPLYDAPKNPSGIIECAIDLLREFVHEGKTILVHCSAGMSRAPRIVCEYLRRWEDYVDPVGLIKTRRAIVSDDIGTLQFLIKQRADEK